MTNQIKELTKEQEDMIPVFLEKWIKNITRPIEKDFTTAAIKNLYANLEKPCNKVVYSDSPLASILLSAFYLYFDDNEKELNKLKKKQTKNVLDNIKENIVKIKILENIVNTTVQQYVKESSDLKSESFCLEIVNAFFNQEKKGIQNFLSISNNNSIHIQWLQPYAGMLDFVSYIGVEFDKDKYKLFMDFTTNVHFIIPYEDIAFVSLPPPCCHWDTNRRLHHESRMSLEYEDGFGLYSWHGVQVPNNYIANKESLTKEVISAERNIELRRCIMEILGNEEYCRRIGLVEVDKDSSKSEAAILYRTKNKDNIIDEYEYFVKVICPSTDREYMLRVPPTKDCWSAVAWTFGKDVHNYDPVKET